MVRKDKIEVEDNDESSRRKVLRSLSLAGSMGCSLGLLSDYSGTASASPDNHGSDSGVGKDQRIAPPGSYGPSDEEHEAAREEDAERYGDDVSFKITDIPNPGDLPIDVCTSVGGGEEVCITTSELLIQEREDCYGNKTPLLYTYDVSVTLYEYEDISWETEFFIGIDEDECVWVGHPETEVCATVIGCDMVEKVDNIVFAPGPIIDAAENYGEWVNDHPDIVIGAAGIVLAVLAAMYLSIGAIIVALVGAGVSGGFFA